MQGGLGSLQSLTGIVGPLVSTGTFAYFTAPGHPQLPGAPFLLGAVFSVVTGVLATMAMARRRSDPTPQGA